MKDHKKDGTNMPVLHDKSETVYVSNLARFELGAEASRYPEDWLGYCMLLWPPYTLPLLDGLKV